MTEPGGWLLTADELEHLSPDELAEYESLLASATTPTWDLAANPKAYLFHLIASKVDWTLGGGSAGGGKSEALAYHARELAAGVAGSHSLVLRSSKPELRRSFILRTLVRFAQTGDSKRAKYAERTGVVGWWWKNNSIIEFGYAARPEDAGQYLSAEYDLVVFDESTQFDPRTITMICGRLRTTKDLAGRGSRPHAMFASNPGDISHEWHKDLFVDLTEYGRFVVVLDIYDGFTTDDGEIDWEKCRIVDRVPAPTTAAEAEAFTLTTDPERHLSIAFVPFGPRDNPFLDPSVMRGLNALPEMERKQKRDGDWDAFTGRYFTEFGDVHLVDSFDPPPSWDHGLGLDHGWSAPFAALYGAWDGDGNCWLYDELYERERTPREQADMVLAKLERVNDDGKKVKIRPRSPVADPAVFATKGEGLSIAQQWAAAGLHAVPAMNSRVDGWMNMREYLRVPIDDDGNMTGKPKLFVMPDRCPMFVREMRNARQNPRHPDDVDTTGADHLLDACRYLLATRPRRRRKREDRFADLPRLERREALRLDAIRRRGRATARRLGLDG